MSAPAAREVEAQSLDFDDLEEIFATGTLPIFRSRNVRRRSPRIDARQTGCADCP
jgi:hypothetical protein